MISLITGYILDLLIGDPQGFPHPVRLIGKLINNLESKLRAKCTEDAENFNCLFCYCPLYMLKGDCGGNFIKNRDIKDCSHCLLPHSMGGYERIMSKMKEVVKRGSDF